MFERLRSFSRLSGVLWLVCIAAIVAIGCQGASPFLAAQFATNISNFLPLNRGQSSQPTTTSTPAAGTNSTIASVCELPTAQRGLQMTIFNESQQLVRFSMTFFVSAGPGGFVCDDEITRYESAGYTDACPPGQCGTFTVGCDTITLLSGTRLLRLDFGINQGPTASLTENVGGDPAGNLPSFQLRLGNGSTVIPLPEIIVMGNEDINFTCLGGDLCTQRGFVYSSPPPANLPIGKAAEVSRIQGTVCNKHFGTAPEWQLDKTPNNGQIGSFQYPAGGTIIVNVLDRSTDALTNNRNQAVWLVTDSGGTTVHFPER